MSDQSKPYGLLADGFQLLATVFLCPRPQIAEFLANGELVDDMGAVLEELTGSSFDDSDLVEASRAEASGEKEVVLSCARREYTRLFTDPASSLVPIYETLFRAHGVPNTDFGMVLASSPEARDSLAKYEAAGLKPTDGESPDHAAVQCELLGFLCRKLEQDPQSEVWLDHLHRFVEGHFEGWFPEFFWRVENETNSSYFMLAAKLGSAVCGLVRAC